jgi:hypothetical protein
MAGVLAIFVSTALANPDSNPGIKIAAAALHTFAFKVREDCERCNIGWVHFGHKKEE